MGEPRPNESGETERQWLEGLCEEDEREFDEWENAGRYYPNTLYPTPKKDEPHD